MFSTAVLRWQTHGGTGYGAEGRRLEPRKSREMPGEVRKAGELWKLSRVGKVTEEEPEAVSLSVLSGPPASELTAQRFYEDQLTVPSTEILIHSI